jgi:hypothetical protein
VKSRQRLRESDRHASDLMATQLFEQMNLSEGTIGSAECSTPFCFAKRSFSDKKKSSCPVRAV